jgi:hypothetical protein
MDASVSGIFFYDIGIALVNIELDYFAFFGIESKKFRWLVIL